MSLKVYMGHDDREQKAYYAAVKSLHRTSKNVEVVPLHLDRLRDFGLLRRPVDRRGGMYDLTSNAAQSTDFAISRFLVPHLHQTGWALFTDCDVIFLTDVAELFALASPEFAVMAVKHQPLQAAGLKMDGQHQAPYPRKNWSSVVLWNCDHPANKRLSLQDVNERPGRDLHAFYWLHDAEIGQLPPEWNWLVNVEPKPEAPKIAHFTQGGAWIEGWPGAEHDDIWTRAYEME